MTTLLERASSLLGAASPEAIQAKIDVLQASLPSLQDAVGDCAFAVEQGDAGAASKLADARSTLTQARERIEELGMSLSRAIAKRDTATAEQRAAIRRSQHEAMKSHLRLRDEAGARLAEHLASAVNEWRAMCSATEALVAATPAEEKLPMGSGATLSELHTAVLSEVWRVGGGPPIGHGWGLEAPPPSFPGANCVDPTTRGDPSRAVGLVASLRQSTEFLLRTLINRKPGEVL